MQKLTFRATGFLAVWILFVACNGSNSQRFSSKSDSLAFARAVLEQYPETTSGESLSDTVVSQRMLLKPGEGFSPISWEQVLDYGNRYDADPCLKSANGVFYQGFSIDTAGYTRLMNTKSIKGLYLRLGRKPDGDHTIMVLGTGQDGKIINTGETYRAPQDSTNFDSLQPCPDTCP
jgi:hypothetical protein